MNCFSLKEVPKIKDLIWFQSLVRTKFFLAWKLNFHTICIWLEQLTLCTKEGVAIQSKCTETVNFPNTVYWHFSEVYSQLKSIGLDGQRNKQFFLEAKKYAQTMWFWTLLYSLTEIPTLKGNFNFPSLLCLCSMICDRHEMTHEWNNKPGICHPQIEHHYSSSFLRGLNHESCHRVMN